MEVPGELISSAWCNTGIPNQKTITVVIQNNKLILTCDEPYPFLYFFDLELSKYLSIIAKNFKSEFLLEQLTENPIDCKKRYKFKCLEDCRESNGGWISCESGRRPAIRYPQCKPVFCYLNRIRAIGPRVLSCGNSTEVLCKKDYVSLHDPLTLYKCTADGWDPEPSCYNPVQVCKKLTEIHYQFGRVTWPATLFGTYSRARCQFGGVSARKCRINSTWDEPIFRTCKTRINNLLNNIVRNTHDEKRVKTLRKVIVSNETYSSQDISIIVDMLTNLTADTIEDSHLELTSQILAIERKISDTISNTTKTELVDALFEVIGKYCANRNISIRLSGFSVSCDQWFGDDSFTTIATLNRNLPMLATYQQDNQISDFIMVKTNYSTSRKRQAIYDFQNTGGIEKSKDKNKRCVLIYPNGRKASNSTCTNVNGPKSTKCICSRYYGLLVLIDDSDTCLKPRMITKVFRVLQTVSISLLITVLFTYMISGNHLQSGNLVHLNFNLCTALSQSMFLVFTLDVYNTLVCTAMVIIAEFFHLLALAWAAAESALCLHQVTANVTFVRISSTMVYKIAVVLYIAPALFPVIHVLICGFQGDFTRCLISYQTCWPDNTSQVYLFWSVAMVLISFIFAFHLISIVSLVRNRTLAGQVESRSEFKKVAFCTLTISLMYILRLLTLESTKALWLYVLYVASSGLVGPVVFLTFLYFDRAVCETAFTNIKAFLDCT